MVKMAEIMDEDDVFFTRDEAAEFLRMNPRTLANLAVKGEGPPHWRSAYNRGGKVLYLRSELLAWAGERFERIEHDHAKGPLL